MNTENQYAIGLSSLIKKYGLEAVKSIIDIAKNCINY